MWCMFWVSFCLETFNIILMLCFTVKKQNVQIYSFVICFVFY